MRYTSSPPTAPPPQRSSFASAAIDNGFGVIIAGAGKAAHLGGVLAAYTTLPVIGVPIKTSMMGGLDSLLSMVQMPSGVPVATVAVNGAANAAILAAQMLAISDAEVHAKLVTYKADMRGDRHGKGRQAPAGAGGITPSPIWIPTTT